MTGLSVEKIYSILSEVMDPEIPVLSIVDLGVITDVVIAGEEVKIEMTPTFVGCPAIDVMQSEIRQALQNHGVTDVSVSVSFKKPWNSDMISEKGREALKKYGFAPPPRRQLFADLEVLEQAQCPRCGGVNTDLRNTFGPTLCRSIHYCHDCREAFEQFKSL